MTQQHQIPQPALHPPKRQRQWLWAALGVAIAVVLAVLIGNWPATQPSTATTHTVRYEADGAGARGVRTATYTIQTDNGGTSQGTTNLPMLNQAGGTGLTYTFHSGDFVYLSVQNGDAAGSVTCRILVDGAVVSENTSTGGYVIATCQGRVP